ncbi:hypothetical protein [Thauera humireducens]|uniref:hypothetical protein n=1 Tax=Thauera humireducens TaxID=1134435 RepID=UPI00311EFB87
MKDPSPVPPTVTVGKSSSCNGRTRFSGVPVVDGGKVVDTVTAATPASRPISISSCPRS